MGPDLQSPDIMTGFSNFVLLIYIPKCMSQRSNIKRVNNSWRNVKETRATCGCIECKLCMLFYESRGGMTLQEILKIRHCD